MDLRIFTEPQQGASYDDLLRVARAAEDAGYDAFFRSDHYLAMGEANGLPGPSDAWVTLAAVARETRTIRLGTLMTAVTFRLPGPLGIAVAQVDQMSGGRVELGIGTGWYEAEHRAYGIPFPPLGERFAMLTEQLEILTGSWRTPVGVKYTHHGEHYTFDDSPGLPKPAQTPHPPIIVGGNGPRRTPVLAATYATEFNMPFVGLDDLGVHVLYDRVHHWEEDVEHALDAVGGDDRDLLALQLVAHRLSLALDDGGGQAAGCSATFVQPCSRLSNALYASGASSSVSSCETICDGFALPSVMRSRNRRL